MFKLVAIMPRKSTIYTLPNGIYLFHSFFRAFFTHLGILWNIFFLIHLGPWLQLQFYVRITGNVCFEKAHNATHQTGTLVLGWYYKVRDRYKF